MLSCCETNIVLVAARSIPKWEHGAAEMLHHNPGKKNHDFHIIQKSGQRSPLVGTYW